MEFDESDGRCCLSVRGQRVRYEYTTAPCRYEASNRFRSMDSFAIRALNKRAEDSSLV
jgi:hypothetical protein